MLGQYCPGPETATSLKCINCRRSNCIVILVVNYLEQSVQSQSIAAPNQNIIYMPQTSTDRTWIDDNIFMAHFLELGYEHSTFFKLHAPQRNRSQYLVTKDTLLHMVICRRAESEPPKPPKELTRGAGSCCPCPSASL